MSLLFFVPVFITKEKYIDNDGMPTDFDTGWLATWRCVEWLGVTIAYKITKIKDLDCE